MKLKLAYGSGVRQHNTKLHDDDFALCPVQWYGHTNFHDLYNLGKRHDEFSVLHLFCCGSSICQAFPYSEQADTACALELRIVNQESWEVLGDT